MSSSSKVTAAQLGRISEAGLLLMLGSAAARFGLTSAGLAYVKPSMQPLLLAAALVLAVLGLLTLRSGFSRRGAGPSAGHDGVADASDEVIAGSDGITLADAASQGHADAGAGEHGHDHGRSPRIAYLLALPIMATLLVAPTPLGAYAAARQGGAPVATIPREIPLGEAVEGAIPMSLGEFTWRALFDEDASLEGERVRLLGFAVPRDDGGYDLTRFAVSCCAADGRAIQVQVAGDEAPRAENQWLEVEGAWQADAGDGGDPQLSLPVISADEVTPVEQPTEPYEY